MMELSIKEKYLLLILDDEKGKHETGAYHVDMGFVAAGLLDLVIDEKVKINKGFLEVSGTGYAKNPVDRFLLSRIKSSRKNKKVKYWISALSGKGPKLRKQTCIQLVGKGVLRKVEKRFLGIRYYRFPTLNPHPENEFRMQLLQKVNHFNDLSQSELALLAILKATDSLRVIIPNKNELKALKKRIGEAVEGNEFGDAIKQAVQEMTAVLVSTMVVTTAATT